MARTTLANIISKIKRRVDYDITDTGLDTILTDIINDTVKLINQWLYDVGNFNDSTGQSSFQTIPGQEYRDVTKAVIVGDTTTFTGIAGDTIDVNVDGTDYADIDISACTDIDDVVTAINTAVGSTVASNNATSGTLQITSPTTGSTSTVTIADGTSTVQTVVGDLFSVALDRTATGISDLADIIQVTERENDSSPVMIPYNDFKQLYPSPTEDTSKTAVHISRINNLIYFGPTPNSYIRYYIAYFILHADLGTGDSLPFSTQYDPLVIAQARLEYLMFFDSNNQIAIANAKALRDTYKSELITNASYNRKLVQQSSSRNDVGIIGPQAPETGVFT